MSTTVTELGAVYCSVVSFANKPNSYEIDRGAIVQSLLAIRLKLKRSLVLRTNIIYEVRLCSTIPLLLQPATAADMSPSVTVLASREVACRAVSEDLGDPTVRVLCLSSSAAELTYSLLPCVGRQVGYLLSHLMSVVEQLEPAWRRAFLRRTRFVDADFQGDVLAVIST